MSASPEDPRPSAVVAAIITDDPTALADTLEAVRAQVYEPADTVIVGRDPEARRFATESSLVWVAGSDGVFDGAGPDVTHIWFVFSGAKPRPDALGSLVRSAQRVDAGVAGSKILDREEPSLLRSVGYATDVFEVPYTGFEDGERDQGQHDVVRDVAAVSPVSILVRKDLALGLGGIDRGVGPMAAATDLCQRARLRGARVIVAPSSEVLFSSPDWKPAGWQEQAGRIRAMIKVYGGLTLAWALPLTFFVGLADAFLSLFVGRWRFFAWVNAWIWNIVNLTDSISERRRAREGRIVGDSELFLYQVRGSVALRTDVSTLTARIRARLPGEDRLSIETIGSEIRQPSFITGVLVALFVLIATRSIWTAGVPAVGYSLPFPDSGLSALGAYAGGWNPGGLGSVEPLRPFLAVAGAVQTVLLDNQRLAEYALVAGAYAFGIWGTVRLLRTWAIQAVPGAIAGLVFVAGSASQGIASNTHLGTLVALGALPWTLRVALSRWPDSLIGRVGRVAALTALTALLAALSPLLLPVPTLMLLVWCGLNARDLSAWRSAGTAFVAAVFAIPFLIPWVLNADLGSVAVEGNAFWTVSVVTTVAVFVAAVATLVSAPPRLGLVAGWGAILVAGAALVARANDVGAGAEVESAALAVIGLGTAAIVGSSLESILRMGEVVGWRRIVAGVAVAGSIVVVLATSLVLLGGRAGLPRDRFTEAFEFTAARPGAADTARILVVGAPGALPGDERILDRSAYRVVSAPMPSLWEAALNDPLLGDQALETRLKSIVAGETSRAGEELAAFGVRWVVVLTSGEGDEHARSWVNALEGHLDLIPLGAGLADPTFEIEAENTVRALTGKQRAWVHAGTGYEGISETAGRVAVRENANDRWGPGPWVQLDWASEVATDTGEARFDAIPNRRIQASVAGVAFLALLGVAWVGRRFG